MLMDERMSSPLVTDTLEACDAAYRQPITDRACQHLDLLQQRFASLIDALPPLHALAQAQGIDAIRSIDDIAPLLFPADLYKSYPEELLASRDFSAMTRWLDRLTTCDLSSLFDRSFATIDAWLEAIDNETALMPCHSSGTTGRMSFFPRGKVEFEAMRESTDANFRYWYRADPADYTTIWATYDNGRSAILRSASLGRHIIGRGAKDFFPLTPGTHSSDVLYAIIKSQESGGKPINPTPYVRQKLEEAQTAQRAFPKRLELLLDMMNGEYRGRKLFMTGGPGALHQLAKMGLERGMTRAFPEGSILCTFGGLKGQSEVPNMLEETLRFTGPCHTTDVYGLTEISGGLNMCAQGHYHCPPHVIPFIFDPERDAMKPREGRQSGRIGFFDLLPTTHWGGIMSLDEVTVDWTPCGCGTTTPYVLPGIKRSFAPDFDDNVYACAASREAVDAAIEVLTEGSA